MTEKVALLKAHPAGESGNAGIELPGEGPSLDTFAGKVQIRWVPDGAVSTLGLLPFFTEFLKTSGLFEAFVADCPLEYTSANAPKKRDVLGTILLSVLAGHSRYAHISAIRHDGVNPELLGMTKIVSEDSVRRALQSLDEERGGEWLKKHLKASYEPLLDERWALDIDATVKLLYGHQENAKVGYNPTKPGRPSHAFHSYFIANLRLVVDVEVQAGNQTASSFAQPELWNMLDGLKESGRLPSFLRGDCAWGTDRAMQGAEQRNIPYLFKLKQTANVKKLIVRLFGKDSWVDAGQNWEGLDTELQLSGWNGKRRVVVLRRPLRDIEPEKKPGKRKAARQLTLDLPEAEHCGVRYEYAVLVTSLGDEVRAIAQHYRDRGDAENNFDELKNQWGWAGFTTQDSKRCQTMARMTALIYNWWTIFMRLGLPDQHAEAITSRPLAMYGIARRTKHANQITVDVTSMHAKASLIGTVLSNVSSFLKRISSNAEQWTQLARWRLILSAAFRAFLRGKVLGCTPRFAAPTG
jgi:Transposase DDE domain group 1